MGGRRVPGARVAVGHHPGWHATEGPGDIAEFLTDAPERPTGGRPQRRRRGTRSSGPGTSSTPAEPALASPGIEHPRQKEIYFVLKFPEEFDRTQSITPPRATWLGPNLNRYRPLCVPRGRSANRSPPFLTGLRIPEPRGVLNGGRGSQGVGILVHCRHMASPSSALDTKPVTSFSGELPLFIVISDLACRPRMQAKIQ